MFAIFPRIKPETLAEYALPRLRRTHAAIGGIGQGVIRSFGYGQVTVSRSAPLAWALVSMISRNQATKPGSRRLK